MTIERANAMVRETIERLIGEGREIGVQAVAYLDGRLAVDVCAGHADLARTKPVQPDTLFNVYSVTKAVTVTAMHLQVERGRIGYDDLVVKYWPEYAQNGKGGTTVRDIITHRSGLPQMPDEVTPELICDWDRMVAEIAAMTPIAPPGTRALYQSMTHGWLVGELVRRSDPQQRLIGQFVREEIAEPLGITDLWIGLPDDAVPRFAEHVNASPPYPTTGLPPLFRASMPEQVDLIPAVFERPDVRRAMVAAVGGIFNGLSCARFWALLAQGGELDGVRLLSAERVAQFNIPRGNPDEPDVVMFGRAIPLSNAGFWLGGSEPPIASAKHQRAICHPGAGNSFGWADPQTRLAAAVCHNRMFQPSTREEDSTLEIADAIRAALGVD